MLGDLLPNGKDKAPAAPLPPPATVGRTPQWLDSVVVPTVTSAHRSPSKRNGKAGESMKFGTPTKVANAAASAAEKSDPRVRGKRRQRAPGPRASPPLPLHRLALEVDLGPR